VIGAYFKFNYHPNNRSDTHQAMVDPIALRGLVSNLEQIPKGQGNS
jgi:hypothetical protein